MGKFCSQCGRPLAEGEVCNCTQAQPVQPQAQPVQPQGQPVQPQGQPVQSQGQPVQPQGQPVQPQGQPVQPQGQPVQPQGQYIQPQMQYQQPKQDTFFSGESNIFVKLLDIIKSPAKKLEAVGSHKYGAGYGSSFIGASAVIFMFCSIVYLLYMKIQLGEYSSFVKIPFVQIALMLLIFTAASGFARAALLFAFDAKVFHGDTTFGKTSVVVGAKAILSSVLCFVMVIGFILNVYIGMFMLGLAVFAALAYSIVGYTQVSTLDADKKVAVVVIVEALMILVNVILLRIFVGSMADMASGYLSNIFSGLF